jgi:hypothetical protein
MRATGNEKRDIRFAGGGDLARELRVDSVGEARETWVRDPRQSSGEQGLERGENVGATATIVHSKAKTY